MREVSVAFDAFLKIDGIFGESTDDKHKHWIEVLDCNHGLTQPSSATAPGSVGNVAVFRRGLDGQKDIAVIDTTGELPPPCDDHRNVQLCCPRAKAKGGPLYDRKATSSLDETARSECTNQGVYLKSRLRRAAERTWLFVARAIDGKISDCAALNDAVDVGGLL